MRLALGAVAVLLVACGGEDAPIAEPTEPTSGEAEPEIAADPAPTPAEGPAALPEVDLLHAVPTEVVVSSVYRGSERQAGFLVDDDLETAWNSRTGELEDAWIAIRLPDGAYASRIEMTVGFTRVREGRDLFTGNHRVRRVRVRHGEARDYHTLDPSSRASQALPVTTQDRWLLVEIVELVTGERSDWREVCISDLKVFGTAPGQREGSRQPTLSVGASDAIPFEIAPPASLTASSRFFEVTDRSCVQSPIECVRHADLPAVSADGRRIAGLMELRTIVDAAAVFDATELRLDLIDARDGQTLEELPVVTAADHNAWTTTLDPETCDDVGDDEPCDPLLGEPLPALEQAADARLRASFVSRIGLIGQRMGGDDAWRTMTRESVVATVANDDDDDYATEWTLTVTLSGDEVFRRAIDAPCEDCFDAGATAWLDPDTRTLLVRFVAQSEDVAEEHVRWFVARLPAG